MKCRSAFNDSRFPPSLHKTKMSNFLQTEFFKTCNTGRATVRMASFPSLTYAESQTEFSFCKDNRCDSDGCCGYELTRRKLQDGRVARTLKTTLGPQSLHKRSKLKLCFAGIQCFFFFQICDECCGYEL